MMLSIKLSLQNKLFLSLIVLCLTSCSGNQIYFDINNQSVKTCSGAKIRELYITSLNTNEYYIFSTMPGKFGVNEVSFNNLNHEYMIEYKGDSLIKTEDFKLHPDMNYEIKNTSNGDAAESIIKIKTGKNRIIFSNTLKCD
jgi:hypothetical protein